MNNLGWILATHPDPLVRDPAEALDITERAAQLTGYRDPLVLGTLAPAYAAAGEFSQAMTFAVRAASLVKEAELADVAAQTKQHLESYRQRNAFIDRSLTKPVVNK
jgi:spermidine synthase